MTKVDDRIYEKARRVQTDEGAVWFNLEKLRVGTGEKGI